jgi:uncharacterized membrane protein
MNILAQSGKILFAIPIFIFGVFHFINTQSLENVVPVFLPGQTLWVYLTGAALVAAGLSIAFNFRIELVCNLLAAMLILFVLLIHLPAAMKGDQAGMTSALKDTALAGGALIIGRFFHNSR